MPTSIDELSRPPSPIGRRDLKRPVPDLERLPVGEATEVRERLAKLDRACGCDVGAAVAFSALVLYIMAELTTPGQFGGSLGATIGIGLALFIISAGAGKTFGLMLARHQRNQLLDELDGRTAEREWWASAQERP